MMTRRPHAAILQNAALLVPAAERAEWLAEWEAELCYVEHDATAFCLGSFRDALWLRCNSLRTRRAWSLDSPLRCVLFLAGLAALTFGGAITSGNLSFPSWSLEGAEELVQGLFMMYAMALFVLLTLDPLALGRYPTNQFAPSLLIRLRRWIFLAVKIALLSPMILFAMCALAQVFPPAPLILFPVWMFGFRWALADQRHRCPVCLHLLSNPVRIGSAAQMCLGRYGTELVCTRGHGFLYIPDAPTSWCPTQRWRYLDLSRSLVR
jgi:hypothetical protein